MSCRECPRCTVPALVNLVAVAFRLGWWAATFWYLGLVTRNCPVCRHRLRNLKRFAGRFVD